jgi:hypothetical protein
MTRQNAIDALVQYAGTDPTEAGEIVDALLEAVQDEALDVVAGSDALPTSIADLRAGRLVRFYEKFKKRALTRLEVQTLFRVPTSLASSIDRRMRGTYPATADRLYKAEIEASAGPVQRGGNADDGYEYNIAFAETSGLDAAETLLARQRLHVGLVVDRANRQLTVPFGDDANRAKRIVKDVLGLSLP